MQSFPPPLPRLGGCVPCKRCFPALTGGRERNASSQATHSFCFWNIPMEVMEQTTHKYTTAVFVLKIKQAKAHSVLRHAAAWTISL